MFLSFHRRCHSQRFTSPGVFHYTCVSLTKQDKYSEYAPDDIWSTVLVDTAVTDAIVKNIDPTIFRQDTIHIIKVGRVLSLHYSDFSSHSPSQ